METRFKCVICGKLTAGRISREGNHSGDASARFPRRHKNKKGEPCPGNILEAEWVEQDEPAGERTANARRIEGCMY